MAPPSSSVRGRPRYRRLPLILVLLGASAVVEGFHVTGLNGGCRQHQQWGTRLRQPYHMYPSGAAAGARRRKNSGGDVLRMHGHHGHHHTPADKLLDDTSGRDVDASTASGWRGRVQRLVRWGAPRRRQAARVLFSAFATLIIPALVRIKQRRSLIAALDIGRPNLVAFLCTSVALSLSESIRKEFKGSVDRIIKLGDVAWKHSSPLASTVTDPLKFFRKDGGEDTDSHAADRVTLLGVLINLVLSVAKFVVGVQCHSSALVADAGHSLSDLFSDGITLYAVQVGRLPPDDDHPYGHGKFEAVGSLFLALTLLFTGLSVGAASNRKLMEILATQRRAASSTGAAASLVAQIPTFPALIVAGSSILSKEWLYRVTRRVGEKINSQVVIANAWHHRSDAYSSVLALISIGLAMSVPGLVAADSAAGLLVAGMICMTGGEILGESINQLTDTNNEGLVETVTSIVSSLDDVHEVNRVRARQVGSSALVDVAITTADGLSSSAARTVEERVRWKILEEAGSDVLDAEVHATGPQGSVCPLLLSQGPPTSSSSNSTVGAGGDVRNGSASPGGSGPNGQQSTAVSEVEEEVRRILRRGDVVSNNGVENSSVEPKVGMVEVGRKGDAGQQHSSSSSSLKTSQQEHRKKLGLGGRVVVEGVTVHYQDTVLVNVDVDVRLMQNDAANTTTVADAAAMAARMREVLEESDTIHRANIYLDLNR